MCKGMLLIALVVLACGPLAIGQTSQPAAVDPPATSQPAPAAFPYEGEITADDVYVRSGPGSNFYPTTKLYAADRVQVLEEKYSWLRIGPPPGSFSYIDMTMADKTGVDTATVKADRVNVYTGSSLTDKKREVQTQLDRGAVVTTIGEADGFYMILPPPGASLWISAMYVKPATGPAQPRQPRAIASTQPASPQRTARAGDSANRPSRPATDDDARTASGDSHGEEVKIETAEAAATARLAAMLEGGGEYSNRIMALEARLRETLKRGNLRRDDLLALQRDYTEIATQEEEQVAQAVAKARVGQLRDRIDLLSARDSIVAERADLDTYRLQVGQDVAKIEAGLRAAQARREYDFKGELRTTLIFPPESHTYRLVDTSGRATVVAYVRVTPEMEQNIASLLGQTVGVKAAKREYSPTGVPLIVAGEIVPLVRGAPATEGQADPARVPATQPIEPPTAPVRANGP